MQLRRSLALGLLLGGCRDTDRVPSDARSPPSPTTPPAVVDAPDRRRCAPPAGISGSPTSIAEAVVLLNALPPPVTVACFVQSLDRPLEVFASASPFSAQPSSSLVSPRIFIRNGPLTMAVVPEGLGRRLLEFGEQHGEGRTIKGEIELPLTTTLAPSAPHDRVKVGDGTTCGLCHDDEAAAAAIGFASEVLHPSAEFDVPLARLRREATRCDRASDPDRCDLLAALFEHGEVRAGTLPGGGRLCDH